MVEDIAAVYFGAIGATIKRGVEIDDAGERGGATEVVLKGRLGAALHRLNPELPHDPIEEVVRILSRPPHPTLIQNNRWFHVQLTDGVEIEYRDARMGDGSGETRGGRVRLIDYENPAANELLVVRQLSIAATPRVGSINSGRSRFMPWRPLTMLMLAGALIREPRLTNPTVVMITDRNDLDDQLFDTFAAGRALLRQAPVQAESREQLKTLLDRAAGGVSQLMPKHLAPREYGEFSSYESR